MGKKILNSKALYVVLSILIAISLWFYVAFIDGDEENWQIRNITVQFEGAEALEERGLMIVGEAPTVSVQVRAPMNYLSKLTSETVTATVDVSRIQEASQYTMGYNLSYPSSVPSASIQETKRSPSNVTFTVARYVKQEVELRGVFNGSAAEGYMAGGADDFRFSPGTITVSGQAELVNQIAYAQVIIEGTDLTETVSGEYPYRLMSNSGEPLDGLDVECSAEDVYVTFPIWATAEVELSVKLVAGGGASEADVRLDIEPAHITVAGDKKDVAALSEIVLKTIDLATVRDGDTLAFAIPLAPELNNISGQTEAVVTFHIEGLETKSVETRNISYIGQPEGWNVALITQAITVDIRGTAQALEEITGENVRVVADLSEVNQTAGQYSIAAKIYLDSVGSDAGVLGTEYRVVVSLSR